MKVSHLALESKTDSYSILFNITFALFKGHSMLNVFKVPDIYGIHMHLYPYMRQSIEHLSIYLL